jgi:hypothetical protein
MRLPDSAHTSRPWRIHEVARDFGVEDVWALQTPGDRDEFRELVAQIAAGGDSGSSPAPVRALFAIRSGLGELFGWDRPDEGLDARVQTLRESLPPDLRAGDRGPQFASLPFSSLYMTEDEWAAEIANRTMHGVLHVGWVPDGTGGYKGQLAILVKPNGLLGRAYMAAIRPARHLVVYPAMTSGIERRWRARGERRPAAA